MAEIATVIEKNGGKIVGSLTRKDACSGCHACSVGGNEDEMIITALNSCGADIGDKVSIELTTDVMLKATFIMYGIPLVTLFTGFLLGSYLAPDFGMNADILGFMTGITFLVVTLICIKIYDKKIDKSKYLAVATNIVNKDVHGCSTSNCH